VAGSQQLMIQYDELNLHAPNICQLASLIYRQRQEPKEKQQSSTSLTNYKGNIREWCVQWYS